MQAQTPGKTRFLTRDTWQLRNGSEVSRMNDWLGKNLVPAIGKMHAGPVLVLEAVFAPHVPTIMMYKGYSAFDQIASEREKLAADPALKAAYSKAEAGSEQLFESLESSILELTSFSPVITETKQDKPRFFEVRTYHAPTEWQFRALLDRMSGPTTKIFKAHGIEPLFYSSTLFGPNRPNFAYMIPWDTLEARQKAWDAFGADPEWVKARKDSIDKSGQIVAMNDIEIYRATAYSPLK